MWALWQPYRARQQWRGTAFMLLSCPQSRSAPDRCTAWCADACTGLTLHPSSLQWCTTSALKAAASQLLLHSWNAACTWSLSSSELSAVTPSHAGSHGSSNNPLLYLLSCWTASSSCCSSQTELTLLQTSALRTQSRNRCCYRWLATLTACNITQRTHDIAAEAGPAAEVCLVRLTLIGMPKPLDTHTCLLPFLFFFSGLACARAACSASEASHALHATVTSRCTHRMPWQYLLTQTGRAHPMGSDQKQSDGPDISTQACKPPSNQHADPQSAHLKAAYKAYHANALEAFSGAYETWQYVS